MMRFSFLDINGVGTRYLEGGSGAAVILIHGVGMSADSWFWTVPALEKHRRVIAPDLLDNGFTEAGAYRGGPPQPYIVDHLVALLDKLDTDRISLVGSSLGCAIALLTYLKNPDRVDKIVLVGPGAVLEPALAGSDPFGPSYANGRQAIVDPTYESCRARMGRAFFDASRVPDVIVAMQMLMYAMPGALDAFERRMEGLRLGVGCSDLDLSGRIGEIRPPTLVLSGREDIRGDFQNVARSAAQLPNGRLIGYEQCGHWPHMEHPERFNRDLLAFLLDSSEMQNQKEQAA